MSPPAALPPILDATCGSRMIHFDPDCPDVLFMDRREVEDETIWACFFKSAYPLNHRTTEP